MHSRFKFKGEDFEQYFLELMDGRRKEWYDRILIDILFVASRFYRMAIQFRIWMYDKRVIRNHALGCLVVSIGNLSCGGTGKTPVVEVFARTLSEKGRKVAILSRGYRSKKRSFLFRLMQRFRSQKIELPPKVVSDGHNLLLESDYAGDEPYMLASNLRKVAVLVDKDRSLRGRTVSERCHHPRRRLPVPDAQAAYQYRSGRFDRSVRQRQHAAARHSARADQEHPARRLHLSDQVGRQP